MANIKLNNVEYQISDSTLSAPTADFIAHLQTIAGEGLRVVVGGVEYNVDPNKVAGAVADLETLLESLNVSTEPYLTFSSPSSFTLNTKSKKKSWDGELEYSTDTETWNTWDGTTVLSADNGVLYMRGTGNTCITSSISTSTSFKLTGNDISCNGNIENLLDYETVARGEHPIMADFCYSNMFINNTGLVKAPELPATVLAKHCYQNMFTGCENLIAAPELPADALADACYRSMFYGCTNLTTAPKVLPATTLTYDCYNGMFGCCPNLIAAPELSATTLAANCCIYMFEECTSLAVAPELPATTLAEYCYFGMFYKCAGLTAAPKLPATILAESCYDYMFAECTSITTAPELPATTLAKGCYSSMFEYCAGLTVAPKLPATVLANKCYFNMFACTGLTTIPELPATVLADNCYEWMFDGCTGIKLSETQTDEYQTEYRIPASGVGTDANDALTSMFDGTGGTFTGTPSINTVYYTSNAVV